MATNGKSGKKVGGRESGKPTLDDPAAVIRVVNEYRLEAEAARRDRIAQNKQNWNTYFGKQDFGEKSEGQSEEVLPKVAEAVEQFSAFVKRALTQFGDWFSGDVPATSPVSAEQARKLMRCYLDDCVVGPNKTSKFPTIISNALKSGLLESLIVLKVHGQLVKERTFMSKEGARNPVAGSRSSWKLRIDLVPNEDYYPDPTGRGLYEIHRVERDLVDVQAMAAQGIYDKDVVARIVEDFTRTDEGHRTAQDKNQNESTPPAYRKRIVIDECVGTFLNPDGTVYAENALCAIANEKHLIRKIEPNPFWHGRSPFIAVPLIQVPYSVWGKALYDNAVMLNVALNELFNLMLDGGIAEVWGIRQVHTEWLENPAQVSGGVPQGATLAVNENCPVDGKVVERVDSAGVVPQAALSMFALTDREFQSSSLVNDIRMGNLPPRQVKATEVVESSNNSAVMLDSIASDLEHELIERVLEMVWLLIVQNMDDLAADEVAAALGEDAAFALSRMTPAERYQMFGRGYGFKAFGLSSTLSRARDFQKFMALMQAVGTNPLMMQAFMARFSPDKALDSLMKALNINPESWQNTPDEQKAVPNRLAQMMQMAQITGGAQRASPSGGMENTNGEISQNAAPSGGPAGG